MQIREPQQGLSRDLKKILRSDQVSLLTPDRLSYGRDCNSKAILWAKHHQIKFPPEAIVWPETTEEVSRIAAFAHAREIPLVPFGGGSGVCGGTWALRGGVALDLKRMDRLLQVDSRGLRVVAETGINGEILERELQRRGLTLGHFPSSIYAATLGGYLACRSAGQYSTLYGKIEDMVEGLQLVLADGQIVDVEEVRNRPGALDLKEIFVGSEGTLGIMTAATLRIHPRPAAETFFGFSFGQLDRGMDAMREIMQRGLRPAVLRLYDELDSLLFGSFSEGKPRSLGGLLKKNFKPLLHWAKDRSLKAALKRAPWLKRVVDWLPADCVMILGFLGPEKLNEAQAQLAREICKKHHGVDLGEKPGRYWHQHRYSVSYKLSPFFDEGMIADTMEVATTWSRLPALYRAVRDTLGRHALVLAHFSHAYEEGCSIYFTFVAYRETLSGSEAVYDRIWEEGLKACHEAGGTISHHHGVGVLKAPFMKEEWGVGFEWLLRVKNGLDPKGILNPGKLGFP